jgi:acyl carrier protein
MTKLDFKSALEDILAMPRGTLRDDDTRETVPGWSSLVDVQILAYLSSECAIDPDGDLLAAESVADLVELLEEREAISA